MLGDRLKKLRSIHGLSQEELSKRLGMSRGTYAHYEINKRQPDYETLQALANFFEVSTDYLISGKEESNPTSKLPELTQKDEKDIAKRLEQIKNDLEHADGLAFDGEPMSEEAKDSFLDAMEFILNQTKKINKKYTPKKYRKDDKDE